MAIVHCRIDCFAALCTFAQSWADCAGRVKRAEGIEIRKMRGLLGWRVDFFGEHLCLLEREGKTHSQEWLCHVSWLKRAASSG